MAEISKDFYTLLKKRSVDNVKAFNACYETYCFGQCISILRQELDSYMRVLFIESLDNEENKKLLMEQTLRNKKWVYLTKGGLRKKVTDSEIFKATSRLNSWESMVYRFGCSFIHLSSFHDIDKCHMGNLLPGERALIIDFMKSSRKKWVLQREHKKKSFYNGF